MKKSTGILKRIGAVLMIVCLVVTSGYFSELTGLFGRQLQAKVTAKAAGEEKWVDDILYNFAKLWKYNAEGKKTEIKTAGNKEAFFRLNKTTIRVKEDYKADAAFYDDKAENYNLLTDWYKTDYEGLQAGLFVTIEGTNYIYDKDGNVASGMKNDGWNYVYFNDYEPNLAAAVASGDEYGDDKGYYEVVPETNNAAEGAKLRIQHFNNKIGGTSGGWLLPNNWFSDHAETEPSGDGLKSFHCDYKITLVDTAVQPVYNYLKVNNVYYRLKKQNNAILIAPVNIFDTSNDKEPKIDQTKFPYDALPYNFSDYSETLTVNENEYVYWDMTGTMPTGRFYTIDTQNVTLKAVQKLTHADTWDEAQGGWLDGATAADWGNINTKAFHREYTAVLHNSTDNYTVKFRDENDTTELKKVTVQCGDTPVYSGDEPVKSSANGVSYKFYGWKNKATGEVYAKDRLPATYGHTTYLAVFKEVLTITADSDEKTYDGSALTKDTFTVTGYPVDLADADKPVFTVVMTDGSTITNAGTKPNVIATVNGVAVNTENAVLIGDYFVLAANGTLTVNRKAVTITAKDNDKTYDGTALTESGFTTSDLELGDTHNFTVVMAENSTITTVGMQPNVIATVDGVAVTTGTATVVGNYLVTTANGTLAIVKRIVTLTSEDGEKPYDGTPLTKPNVTVGGDGFVEGEVSDIKATGSVTTVADGEVTNTITYTKGDNFNANNYTITKNEGKLTITKSTNALVITSSTKSWTYDGTTHKDEVYTVTYGGTTIAADASGKVFTLPTGDTVTITATADGVKDYNADYDGNNTFKYVLTNAGNYGNVTTNFGTLSIEKRIVTLKSASAEKEYDGTALTSPEVTVGGDGFVAGEVSDLKATGSVTNVGEVINTITYNEGVAFNANNYTITKTDGKLTITENTKALVITSSTKSWTYDGTTHKDEVYTVTYDGTTVDADASGKVFTLPTGDILTITATAAGVKDYNTGYKENNEFTYELTNARNYGSVSTNVGTLSIEKRSVTLTSASAEKEYDGTALTSPEVTVGGDGFVAGEVTDIKATGSLTTVGVVTNTVTFTEGADFKVENYEIIENLGTLTITASTKALEITSSTKSWTYDGKTHKDEVYTVSYGGTSVAADAETDGKVFTLPTGDKVTITATAEGVKDYNAGYKENNTFTYTLENSDCYDNITTNVGTLSINRKAVTITAGSADKYYDETKLTCSEFTATDLEEGDTHEFTVTMTENSAITEMGKQPNVIATVDGTNVTAGEEIEIGNYLVTTVDGTLTIYQGILDVEVTASKRSDAEAGEKVIYTVVVTNKGNTTINGITLSHLPIAETGSSADSFDLAPDGQKTIIYAYTVTQSDVDAGEFTRTSTATGIAHKENAVEASGSATVATVAAKPELTVTKTASVNSDVMPGDTIGYTVVVKNSGNVTVTGITAQYSPIAQTGNAESFNLTPGSTKTLTYNYTVTQADMDAGKFTRTVTVEGLDPSKKAVTASNDVEVTTAAASAKISITKKIEADGAVTIDDTVTYTITVANTGNVSVEDGVLTDNLVDLSEKTFALQPGETATFTYDYIVTKADVDAGSIVNTVKANAKAARGDDPEEVEALTTLPTERYVLNISSADASWTYDGESHTKEEYSVTYGGVAIPADDETGKKFTLGNGDVLTITSTADGVKDYSTEYFANNTFTYTITNDALYESVYMNYGTLSIDKRYVKLISESAQKTYDGTALTGPKVTVEGDGFVEGEVNDLKAEGSVCNVSGDQTFNTITYTTTEKFIPGNYVIAIEEGVLQILEREVTVTLTGNSDSKPYNGELQSVYGYTVDISDPLYTEQDFEYYDVAVTGGVLVGEYPMVILAEQCLNNNANFIVTFVAVNGKMTIKPNNSVVVKITGRDETVVYDGTTHTFDVYDVEINDPVYTIDDFEFNGNGAASGKDAGSYAMTMTPEDFTNTNANFGTVTFEIVNGTLTVEPKEVDIEWSENREYPYDGQFHQPDAWVINLEDGDNCDVIVGGGQTEVGDDYFAYAAGLSNKNYKLPAVAQIPFEIYGCQVIFVDDYGNELLVKTVPYGETPTYEGDEPTKRSYYDEYHYEFIGWTPEFAPVSERYTTYTAQFEEVTNEFTITWVDGKGNVLKTEVLPYGAEPKYLGETPTTNEREGFVYTFAGWYPNVSMVVEDVTYTAQFEEKPAKVYYLESGDGSEHEKESGKSLRFVFSSNYDAETFSHFAGAYMDGKAIPADGYTTTEGSLILDLKAEYLDKLSIGDHTVSVAFDDYETTVEAMFAVVEKQAEPTPEPPTPTPEEPTPEPPTPTPEEPTPEPPTPTPEEPTPEPPTPTPEEPTPEPPTPTPEEPTPEPPTPTPEEPTPEPPTPTPAGKPDDDPKPRTGDTMNMAILAALLGAALATMLFVFMKRREQKEEED